MYTLDRITKEFDATLSKYEITRTVPIKINGRLRTTLGRVMYIYNAYGGESPSGVEFQKRYIEDATDECIHQTILHEAAHYIVMKLYPNERHGHDKTFRQICAELGCTRNKAKGKVEYTEEGKKRRTSAANGYKYAIYCPDCDEVVAKYKTKCNAVKYYEQYYCSTCGCTNLQLITL